MRDGARERRCRELLAHPADPDTPITSRCVTALYHQSQDRIYHQAQQPSPPRELPATLRQLHPWSGANASPPAPEVKPPLGHKPGLTSDPASIISAASPAKPEPRSLVHERGEGAESKCPHWVFVSAQSPCGSPGRASQPGLLCVCGGAAAGSDFLVSIPIFRLSGPGREGSRRFPRGEGQRGRKAAPEPRSRC